MERAKRLHAPITLLMIDIDNFKAINDVFGHQQGDLVLQQVSQVISENVRAYDIFARYGGEEFIALMPETDQQEALDVCQRIISAIDVKRSTTLIQLPTISIGLCTMSNNEYSLEALIKQADDQLLQAKRTGKNRVFY